MWCDPWSDDRFRSFAWYAVQIGEVTITDCERQNIQPRRKLGYDAVPKVLSSLPTIWGRLESVARLTPQSSGGMSFVDRLNNITVDSSYFKALFGREHPRRQNGVPRSLSAIEQIQINVALRRAPGEFLIGAAVNTVWKRFGLACRAQHTTSTATRAVGTKAGSLVFSRHGEV